MMPYFFGDERHGRELYRDGYREGLEHVWPRWTSEYTDMTIDERQVYDAGFNDGRRERWRREDEEEGGWR